MSIWGIEGGIGCGKTLTLCHYGLADLAHGRKLLTNVKLLGITK